MQNRKILHVYLGQKFKGEYSSVKSKWTKGDNLTDLRKPSLMYISCSLPTNRCILLRYKVRRRKKLQNSESIKLKRQKLLVFRLKEKQTSWYLKYLKALLQSYTAAKGFAPKLAKRILTQWSIYFIW